MTTHAHSLTIVKSEFTAYSQVIARAIAVIQIT